MNFFKQLVQSMINPKAIAEYRFQHIGKTVLYVFFLTLIMFIPIAYSAYYNYDFKKDTYDEFLSENSETIEIVDGELVAKPVESYVHDGPGMTVVIDSTTDEVDTEIAESPYIAFLKQELVINTGADEWSMTYSELGIENISNEEFQAGIRSASTIAFAVSAFILYWFMVLASVLTISVFALLLRIATKNPEKPRGLTFGNYWTISAYSTTMMAVFLAIMHSFGVRVVAQDLVSWVTSFVISLLAVKAIPCINK